jgi:hypothetical protein
VLATVKSRFRAALTSWKTSPSRRTCGLRWRGWRDHAEAEERRKHGQHPELDFGTKSNVAIRGIAFDLNGEANAHLREPRGWTMDVVD